LPLTPLVHNIFQSFGGLFDVVVVFKLVGADRLTTPDKSLEFMVLVPSTATLHCLRY